MYVLKISNRQGTSQDKTGNVFRLLKPSSGLDLKTLKIYQYYNRGEISTFTIYV